MPAIYAVFAWVANNIPAILVTLRWVVGIGSFLFVVWGRFRDSITGLATSVLPGVAQLVVPASVEQSFRSLTPVVSQIFTLGNKLFPFSEAMTILMAMLTLQGVVISLRYAAKMHMLFWSRTHT